jgi:GTPase
MSGINTEATEETRAGFVAIVGRPNAGKSTLMNALLGEKISMVSQKANATRKRINAIVMHKKNTRSSLLTPPVFMKKRRCSISL